MNCPCDAITFPPMVVIPAGLSKLPRQLATFPEFRAALLSALGARPALADWRARRSDDFGVMLLEMWSYVCDCISFYDEVIANECYLRTAQLRPSLRKLVAPLGYVPRPAVGAQADLAILAEGRQYLTLPQGTAFRSGAFPGGSPQVFELDADSRVHPFTNQWTLARARPTVVDPDAPATSARTKLLVDPRSVAVKRDQLVLVQDLGTFSNTRMRQVTSVEDVAATDGAGYKQITLAQAVPISGSTPLSNLRLTTPTQKGTIWQLPIATFPTGLMDLAAGSVVVFDSLQRQIHLGEPLVLEKAGDFRWFTIADMREVSVSLPAPGATTITDANNNTSTVTSPAPRVRVTAVRLDARFNDGSRREAGQPDWQSSDGAYVKVHFAFRPAGTPTVAAKLTLQPGAPMSLVPPVEAPQDGKGLSRFLFEDRDGSGVAISAGINFGAGVLTPANPLTQPLVAPVTVYGNAVKVSRGETVPGEVLGSGDASAPNQTFKLKKGPLTYFAAPDGVLSTLAVFVDGLRWTEAASFFGAGPDDQVYIVRQTDAGDSLVTFGDGARGCRLPSGVNNVVATYRFGAGKTSPPAGSINQIAKPVKGVASVRNPVAAAGGDDAEPVGALRSYAPRSALLLGRAISIPDMEAAAAGVAGVRAVRAEWRWSRLRQRPVVQIWYIGANTSAGAVQQRLRGLSDSVTAITAEQATPVPATLALAVAINPRRIEADVLADVRAALMGPESGLLSPERIGIGLPLFRSRIFEAVLGVAGADAVTGLLWNGAPFDPHGITPGAGRYFDLENGTLLLNGKAAGNV